MVERQRRSGSSPMNVVDRLPVLVHRDGVEGDVARAFRYLSQNRESAGISSTHGGHQVAQKWMMKILPFCFERSVFLPAVGRRSGAPARPTGTAAIPTATRGGDERLDPDDADRRERDARTRASRSDAGLHAAILSPPDAGTASARRRALVAAATAARVRAADAEDADAAKRVVEAHRIARVEPRERAA